MHVDGGWDAYLERSCYSSIAPSPLALFGSMNAPPSGQNDYYVDDKGDRPVAEGGRRHPENGRPGRRLSGRRLPGLREARYDIQPMPMLFYPQA